MGFGGSVDAGGQRELANLQGNLGVFGGKMQQEAANMQVAALHSEADFAYKTGLYNAQRAYIQGMEAYGKQAETFTSAGVELQGSPLAQLHLTKMLTDQQVSMYEQQGLNQQNVLLAQADQTELQGLAAYLSSLGESQVAHQESEIQISTEKAQANAQGWGTLLSGGIGLLGLFK